MLAPLLASAQEASKVLSRPVSHHKSINVSSSYILGRVAFASRAIPVSDWPASQRAHLQNLDIQGCLLSHMCELNSLICCPDPQRCFGERHRHRLLVPLCELA